MLAGLMQRDRRARRRRRLPPRHLRPLHLRRHRAGAAHHHLRRRARPARRRPRRPAARARARAHRAATSSCTCPTPTCCSPATSCSTAATRSCGPGPVAHWIEACDRMLALGATTVVPGHGPLSDRACIEDQRGYLEWLVAEGTPRLEGGHGAARRRPRPGRRPLRRLGRARAAGGQPHRAGPRPRPGAGRRRPHPLRRHGRRWPRRRPADARATTRRPPPSPRRASGSRST